MSTIVTRAGKGSPLTNNEVDANFVNLNTDKIESITSVDGSVVITPTGTARDLSVAISGSTTNVVVLVRNTTGATLTKGTAVYISGATGQNPTVSKALATSDATSAQTLGLMSADLANNTNGYVTVIGLITNIDTSAYTDGAQLYLSGTTAGTLTATKPYAPIHLVYAAVVEHAHPSQGKLFVKVQNGYELDEIHDVSIVTPVTGQTLVYNSATDLWVNNTVSLTAGVNGTLPILNGGTGQTTANAAFNALAPSQTGNSGKYLTTDGTDTSWASNPLGTVTSVAATVPSFLSISGSPITTSGTLAFGLSGTALPTTSGGTGLTSFTSGGVVYASSTSALATGANLTFDGTNLSVGGIITMPNNIAFKFKDSTGTSRNTFYLDASNNLNIQNNVNNGNIAQTLYGTGAYVWNNSSTELARLNSTGLGIGTSSPAAKFEVSASFADSAIEEIARISRTGGTTAYATNRAGALTFFDTPNSTLTGAIAGVRDIAVGNFRGSLAFYTTNAGAQATSVSSLVERLRINSDGNVGIGATTNLTAKLNFPSADSGEVINIYSNSVEAGRSGIGKYSGETRYYNGTGDFFAWRNSGPSGTEIMRLTSAGNLGIGTTSPNIGVWNKALTLNTATGNAAYEVAVGGVAKGFFAADASNLYIQAFGAIPMLFSVNGAERGRFDTSGNFFVGTTTNTNTSKLVVNGTISQTVGGTQYLVVDQSDIGTGANEIPLNQYLGNLAYEDNTNLPSVGVGAGTAALPSIFSATDNDTGFWFPAANTLALSTNGLERLRVDSSGNVGIGGSSPAYKLDVAGEVRANNLFRTTDNTNIGLFGSSVFASNVIGIGSSNSVPLVFGTGATERMRLDTAGNLGIGTSSVTNAKLKVSSSTASGAIMSEDTAGTTSFLRILGDASSQNLINWQDGTALRFATSTQAYGTFNERMRIDSAGNLGLGVTPSAWGSIIKPIEFANSAYIGGQTNSTAAFYAGANAYYNGTNWIYKTSTLATNYISSDGKHIWYNAASGTAGNAISFTQAMTLDASGNLLLGTTSSGSLPGDGYVFIKSTSTQYIGHASGTSSGTGYMQFWYAGGSIGSITQSGTTAVLYNLTSDQRLKENIQDAESSSNLIDAIQVRQFDWKSDGSHTRYGFIAQELVTVAPEAVHQPTNTEEMMAVDYSKLVPMLVKEVQSLRARVAQLEG